MNLYVRNFVSIWPIAGGLFLDDGSSDLLNSHDKFAISQDQRNTAHRRLRAQLHPRLWIATGATYGSGLPVEVQDNFTTSLLVQQYGADVVTQTVEVLATRCDCRITREVRM